MASYTRYVLRSDTGTNWETKNPVLLLNEIAYDITARRYKMGDGKTAWKNLPYVKPDVINDLVTGGTTDALSAEQGKKLKEALDALQKQINDGDFTGGDGKAATIKIGKVTTGAAGSPATVKNSGTENAAVLDFSIPKGDAGATGADGKAATITVGTTTTGAAGTNAIVTNVGTTSAARLNFTIPRGATGADGKAATIAVGTVTTGAAGSNAVVTNVGTTSAALFNFTIPRGATGAQGAKGDKGDTGPAGKDGKDGSNASVTIVNVLTDSSATKALSANMGKKLDTDKLNKSAITSEEWTFTLESGSTTKKKVALWA